MRNVTKGVINYTDDVVFAPIPSDEDYEIIKGMMGAEEIPKEELYVYKVLLCDNMVDRDSERFTHKSLERIRDLYVGKVGIKDHSPTAENIHSRIYKTELVVDESRHNDVGDSYEYVLGYAYTINNEENKAFINEIRGGLRKEVSVGLSNKSLICSICGEEMESEGHQHVEGETYDDEVCIGLIDDVDDVYEFSFVAIPSQRKAGIIKAFNKKEERHMSLSLKQIALKICKSADVAPEDAEKLLEEIDRVDKPDKARKALEEERDKLKEDLEKALKEVEEGRTRRTEEYIDRLIDSMKPKNDKMRALARRAIEELIRVDTDGKLTNESERDIRNELESDEYRPLFKATREDEEDMDKSGFEDSEEDTHAIDEAAALEEEREEIINRLESGEYSGFGKGCGSSGKKKSVEFTRKQVSKSRTSNGASCKGIHYSN